MVPKALIQYCSCLYFVRIKMSNEPVNVDEFEKLARQALPKVYYDYYAGGAEDQHTLRANMQAFYRIT